MYQTCLFCNKSLGSNRVVEHFPVGRRLAFDAAKGRLWVICRKCRRWNLTPMEERWEAIEECERFYRGTRARTSTENIGIARHREGLELVRIGSPLRPEFAAWRYGDQMGERMRRMACGNRGGRTVGFRPVQFPRSSLGPCNRPARWWATCTGTTGRPVAKVRVADASRSALAPEHVAKVRTNELGTLRILPGDLEPGFRIEIRQGTRIASFEGEDARRVAGATVPVVNQWGATRGTVRTAVEEIESHGHPGRFLLQVARREHPDRLGRMGFVRRMPKPTRLALEMALHEEQERRALEGELWVLEQAWKEAEEIAAIADDLLLPVGSDEFFERYGGKPQG